MARRKSAAMRAPQTPQAAQLLLERYASLDAQVELIEAARTEAIAIANAAADTQLVPLHAELKDIVKQLQPWWAASIDELTGGKRKSIELGGCLIGERTNPAKVVFSGGKDADAVAALQTAKLTDLLRVTTSLDKPAILKALEKENQPVDTGEDPCPRVLHDMGFSAKQVETFFVERVVQGGTLSA